MWVVRIRSVLRFMVDTPLYDLTLYADARMPGHDCAASAAHSKKVPAALYVTQVSDARTDDRAGSVWYDARFASNG